MAIRSFAALAKSSGAFARQQSQSAAQNNSGAKQSQSDSKSAGKSSPAQTPAASGSIEKRVEDFLRKWYAWGPDFQVKVGPVKPSPAGDLNEVSVEVSAQGGSDTAVVYVTKDGHYMLRGDLQDLNGDPLGDTQALGDLSQDVVTDRRGAADRDVDLPVV